MEIKFLWAFLDFVFFICNLINGKMNLMDKDYDTAAFCYFVSGMCFLGTINCLFSGIAMMIGAN